MQDFVAESGAVSQPKIFLSTTLESSTTALTESSRAAAGNASPHWTRDRGVKRKDIPLESPSSLAAGESSRAPAVKARDRAEVKRRWRWALIAHRNRGCRRTDEFTKLIELAVESLLIDLRARSASGRNLRFEWEELKSMYHNIDMVELLAARCTYIFDRARNERVRNTECTKSGSS